MRRFAVLCCLTIALGCGSGQDEATPDAGMDEAETPMAGPLADFAGTWSLQALTEAGDSVLISYEMTATDGMDGWTVTFPDRDPIPAHIMEAAGDSVVIHLGPYPSALRDDVSVTTMTVSRIVDGRMEGYFTATYDMEGPDNVLRGLQRGERIR